MANEQQKLLVPLDDYLKVGIHIGTKFRTRFMMPFIYKVRPDGLAVLNVQEIDNRIRVAANFLSQFDPHDIIIVCRRENGWRSLELFSKLTGIRSYAGRYTPGVLTNHNLKTFTEVKLVLVVDPWPDKNMVFDAAKLGIPVIAFCDTNNDARHVDLVLPCNNKGKKSLGLIFWILAREFIKSKGIALSDGDLSKHLEEFLED
ncbi:30S ribosomal protein S2 [Candidatus Woesearchaeota archaeon]|nr:30S ribosomal protein S2 [Candidatus Woesearchaeota archaeon]